MKLFLIGSMLLGGTGAGAVALENETVNEAVAGTMNQVREMFQHRNKNNMVEKVKENGFPYPSGESFDSLTEDQQFALTSAVDQINATYNWATMTDEEIADALLLVKADMELLREELGIEAPMLQQRIHSRNTEGQDTKGDNRRQRDRDNCIDPEITPEPESIPEGADVA